MKTKFKLEQEGKSKTRKKNSSC